MSEKNDLINLIIDEHEIARIESGLLSNEGLAEFYNVFGALAKAEGEFEEASEWEKRANAVALCHKVLKFDFYPKQIIKDFQGTFRCRDRFCPMCAKDVANTREFKFKKILDAVIEDYALFHLTLTRENCCGSMLRPTAKTKALCRLPKGIEQMSACFQKLRRYLDGSAKIAGIDFLQYGYAGAIRALEVTFKRNQLYHPHYHVLLALKKDVIFEGENFNAFSCDYINGRKNPEFKPEPFSDFEILIQKIWYLLLNDIRVCKDSIDALKRGYSCRLRKLEIGDYHQTFKYIVKPDKHEKMSFENFQDLRESLYKKRSIQCYGIFHGYKLETDDIDDNYDVLYDKLILKIREYEPPISCSETLNIVKNSIIQNKCYYISRKRVRSFVRKYGLEDEIPFMLEHPDRIGDFVQLIMALPIGGVSMSKKHVKKTPSVLDDARAVSAKHMYESMLKRWLDDDK